MSTVTPTMRNPKPAPQPEHAVNARVITTVIEPKEGWNVIDFRELYEYRDLFWFLTLRCIRGRYAQSALGVGWAVVQPLFSMLVFTLVFGRLARIASDGIPYPLFSFAALVPWTYFSGSLMEGTGSLVQNANMLQKVYFPRLVLPLSTVVAKLVDFSIAMILLFGLMACYGVFPGRGILMFPFLIGLMVTTAAGMCLWLSALAVQYRDVNFGMGFAIQLYMYAAPVVYPASLIPPQYRWIYAMNPMVGVIEGFRSALLGASPAPWLMLSVGTASALIIAVSGAYFFRSRERVFADVA